MNTHGQKASLLIAALFALSGCDKAHERTATANASVAEAHADIASRLDLADQSAFEDARRGFIAAPSGTVTDAEGKVLWDHEAFAFVDGDAPDTVNPSFWRQAKLNN